MKKIIAECARAADEPGVTESCSFWSESEGPKVFPLFFWQKLEVGLLPDQQEEIFKRGCLTEFPMGIFEVFFTGLVDIHNWSRYRSTLLVVSTVGPVLMR